MNYSQMYGYYRTRRFIDIFPSLESFINDYLNCPIQIPLKNENNTTITNLYYMLYAKYGNSHIASFDETQFRYKLWNIVFMYGPTWEKRLEVQAAIRNIAQDELERGNANVNNYAVHPDTEPSTDATDPLSYITNQTYVIQKKETDPDSGNKVTVDYDVKIDINLQTGENKIEDIISRSNGRISSYDIYTIICTPTKIIENGVDKSATNITDNAKWIYVWILINHGNEGIEAQVLNLDTGEISSYVKIKA